MSDKAMSPAASGYINFQKWYEKLYKHQRDEFDSQSPGYKRLVQAAFTQGFTNGVIEGKTAPRSRETCRLTSYTESALLVYAERDRLTSEVSELSRALDEAVTKNKKMHKIVDSIEELLTRDEDA